MFAVAATSPIGAVIESNFHRSVAAADLRRLPGTVIEVFCRCGMEVARERYRARTGSRHAGHFDGVRSHVEMWNEDVSEPVAGGWPVLEVDTGQPVAVDEVLARISASVDR